MQECPYCGQQNSDFEDRCVYCGELLYIQVDHKRKNNPDKLTQDINHQYATKIARELLEDEAKRTRKNKNYDDFSDLTNELLGSNDIFADDTINNEIRDDAIFDDEIVVDKDSGNQDDSYSNNMFEETLAQLEEENEDMAIDDDDSLDEDDIKEYVEDKANEDETPDNLSADELLALESNLKKKLKRNKKLETRIGLSFKNIALVLDNKTRSIEVLGSVSTNTVFDNHCLQVSVICYDNNSNEIERGSAILIMNSIKTYYDFDIRINPSINDVALLILMPEVIEYIPQNIGENKTKENKLTNKTAINKKYSKRTSADEIFIEHMRDIEHRIGMKIDNTSVLIKSENSLEIVGEIYIKHPDKYDNIKIAATCYDKNNKIVSTENTHINTKLYLGFDTLSIKFKDIDVNAIERIRLYPTLQ